MSSVVPTGDCQRILPALRSTATSTPHGGGLQGRPSGDNATARVMANGAPRCGPKSCPAGALKPLTCAAGISVTMCASARCVGIDDLIGGIEGNAAPVHPAAGHRKDQRALGRGRRVEAFVARGGEPVAAGRTVPEGYQAEGVLCGDALRHDDGHMSGKRLRRRKLLAFRAALRHGPLLHRPDRLARLPCRARTGSPAWSAGSRRRAAAAGIDAGKRRLGRHVVVPDVVMHALERPDQRARLGPAAPPRSWRARCCRAACRPRSPGSARRSAGTRAPPPRRPTSAPRHWRGRPRWPSSPSGSQAPAQAPGARIEGPHGPARRVDAAVVGDGRADDDDAAHDDRRRGDLELAGPLERPCRRRA